MPLRSSRRNYNRVSSSPASPEAIGQGNLDEPLSPSPSLADDDNLETEGDDAEALATNQTKKSLPSIQNEINVVLLDGAQTKFIIKCDPKWKVSEFKSASAFVSLCSSMDYLCISCFFFLRVNVINPWLLAKIR